MKRITEVWSNTCELTQPPLLHGDTTYIGTRADRPQGRMLPLILSAAVRTLPTVLEKYSPSSGKVALPISLPLAS